MSIIEKIEGYTVETFATQMEHVVLETSPTKPIADPADADGYQDLGDGNSRRYAGYEE